MNINSKKNTLNIFNIKILVPITGVRHRTSYRPNKVIIFNLFKKTK